MEAAAIALVQTFNGALLDGDFLDLEAASVVCRPRMISQAQVGVAARTAGHSHILKRVGAV